MMGGQGGGLIQERDFNGMNEQEIVAMQEALLA
jgi:hypothetical protein